MSFFSTRLLEDSFKQDSLHDVQGDQGDHSVETMVTDPNRSVNHTLNIFMMCPSISCHDGFFPTQEAARYWREFFLRACSVISAQCSLLLVLLQWFHEHNSTRDFATITSFLYHNKVYMDLDAQ